MSLCSSTGVSQSRRGLELPYFSKYLLIASYLASYNPSKSDKKFFSKVRLRAIVYNIAYVNSYILYLATCTCMSVDNMHACMCMWIVFLPLSSLYTCVSSPLPFQLKQARSRKSKRPFQAKEKVCIYINYYMQFFSDNTCFQPMVKYTVCQ